MRVGDAIYLDHQSTTPVDSTVSEEMRPYFAESFGNPHSVDHALGWAAAQAVEAAADRVAGLIGADPNEIIFTSGATEANNLALLGLARRAAGGKRRRILIGATEHKCVLAASRALEDQLGYQIEHVPVDNQGRIASSSLEAALADDVLIVSIMAVNNEIGTIQDLQALSTLIKSYGAHFHCDAAQAPGAIELRDVSRLVDTLSLSAHKMYGPKGIGALFLDSELHDRIEPLLYGGGQQHNLRSGTLPTALCVGMGAAANLLDSVEAERSRQLLADLRNRFVRNVMALPWPIALNGPPTAERHPGNANLCFAGFMAADILTVLQPRLSASTGSACTSGMPEPSHVLRAIGLADHQAEASIRFSLGRLTTEADVDAATALIEEALSRLAESAAPKRSHEDSPRGILSDLAMPHSD